MCVLWDYVNPLPLWLELQYLIECILKGCKGFAIVVSAVLALVLLDYGGVSFDVLQTRDEWSKSLFLDSVFL